MSGPETRGAIWRVTVYHDDGQIDGYPFREWESDDAHEHAANTAAEYMQPDDPRPVCVTFCDGPRGPGYYPTADAYPAVIVERLAGAAADPYHDDLDAADAEAEAEAWERGADARRASLLAQLTAADVFDDPELVAAAQACLATSDLVDALAERDADDAADLGPGDGVAEWLATAGYAMDTALGVLDAIADASPEADPEAEAAADLLRAALAAMPSPEREGGRS